LGSARFACEIAKEKKKLPLLLSENLSGHTPSANFIFGVLNWDKMDCFLWFCLETSPVWQPLAAQVAYFWGEIW